MKLNMCLLFSISDALPLICTAQSHKRIPVMNFRNAFHLKYVLIKFKKYRKSVTYKSLFILLVCRFSDKKSYEI